MAYARTRKNVQDMHFAKMEHSETYSFAQEVHLAQLESCLEDAIMFAKKGTFVLQDQKAPACDTNAVASDSIALLEASFLFQYHRDFTAALWTRQKTIVTKTFHVKLDISAPAAIVVT